MANSTWIKKIILCTVTLSLYTPPVSSYDLDKPGSSGNPMLAEYRLRNDGQAALVTSVRLFGGDTFAGYGGACLGDEPTCFYIWRRHGGTTTGYYGSSDQCLPERGPGTLQAAAQSLAQRAFVGQTLLKTHYQWGDTPSKMRVAISPCSGVASSYHVVYDSDGSAESPLICALDAPAIVDLGQATASSSLTVGAAVSCAGESSSSVRVSVSGASSLQPTPGLELWTKVPSASIIVSGDGTPTPIAITVGATVANPNPGPYSGSFVYLIEYL